MRLVNIPVSRFVKKILLSENNETEPIQPNRQNEMLYILLSCGQFNCRYKAERLEALLPESVQIIMGDWLASQVEANPHVTGILLHRLYRNELNKFIASRVEIGRGVQETIYEYCDKHDIDIDEDITLDSITRYWRRYNSKENARKIEKKFNQGVRKYFTKSKTPALYILPYLDSELDDICTTYMSRYPQHFLTLENKPYKYRSSQLRCWVYKNIGRRSGDYIAQKFKMKRDTVFSQVYSFSVLLRTLPAIQE